MSGPAELLVEDATSGLTSLTLPGGQEPWLCQTEILKQLPLGCFLRTAVEAPTYDGQVQFPSDAFCAAHFTLLRREILDYQRNVARGMRRMLVVTHGVVENVAGLAEGAKRTAARRARRAARRAEATGEAAAATTRRTRPPEVYPLQALPALVLALSENLAQPAPAQYAPLSPTRAKCLAYLGFTDLLAMVLSDGFLAVWALLQATATYRVSIADQDTGFEGYWWDEGTQGYRGQDQVEAAVWAEGCTVEVPGVGTLQTPLNLLSLIAKSIEDLTVQHESLRRQGIRYPSFDSCMELLQRRRSRPELDFVAAAARFGVLGQRSSTDDDGRSSKRIKTVSSLDGQAEE
eukprot:g54098.t1